MIEIWIESVRFNSSQRLDDLTRIILKKGCFSDFEILEVCGWATREEHVSEETITRIETQNIENQNTKEPSITISILKQEGKKNLELIKKIMTEKKTTLLSFKNQNWGKYQGGNRKDK